MLPIGGTSDEVKCEDLVKITIGNDATKRMTLYQERMMRYYNQRVKLKRFNPRDIVLRKVSEATKDPSEEKLGPNWEGPYKVFRH